MCGRFALGPVRKTLRERFGLDAMPEAPDRYNIAPGQLTETLLWDDALTRKRMALMRWGLVPFWAGEASRIQPMHNARAETVWEKPAFRAAVRRRRCLVLAQGFYEWTGPRGRRDPWFITPKNGETLAFAGIWEQGQGRSGDAFDTVAILTCQANDFMAPLHERMPVVVSPQDDMRWLSPGDARPQDLEDILVPRPWPGMAAWRVGPLVNRADAEGPELIDPAPALEGP